MHLPTYADVCYQRFNAYSHITMLLQLDFFTVNCQDSHITMSTNSDTHTQRIMKNSGKLYNKCRRHSGIGSYIN